MIKSLLVLPTARGAVYSGDPRYGFFFRSLINMPISWRRRTFIMASLIKFSLMIVAAPKLEAAVLGAVVFIGFTG